MNLYTLFSIIISGAIIIAYINSRYIKMQTTIAMLSAALIMSISILIIGHLGFVQSTSKFTQFMQQIDFHSLLINGMLSFLLFAGSLNIDIQYLRDRKWEVIVLSSLSTIASTILVGVLIFYLVKIFNIHLEMIYCLLFGALISPTDPIAVLAIFKKLQAPERLHVLVEGESLFNDGVAIVIFLTLYHFAFLGVPITFTSVTSLFLHQSIGGICFGILLGFVAYKFIKPLNNSRLEILMTLVIPTGGYALANQLGFSGPLAMVVAGIFLGNRGNLFSVSGRTKENLDNFWTMVDDLLNAILFMLMGLELLVIQLDKTLFLLGICAIPLVLIVRFITVAIPMTIFKRFKTYNPYIIRILTWGGLRGGLAIALALALPKGHHRIILLAMTYSVVVFAIIVQGLSIKFLVNKSQQST